LAIQYAELFAVNPAAITDDLFAALRAAFSDPEILDLTLCVAVFLGLGRTLAVLGIDTSCAIEV
jgi:alkylhydroperoxidase family enzyme